MAETNSLNALNEPQEQLVISYELLCLLQWFIEHDADKLKAMIGIALSKGVHKEINSQEDRPPQTLEDIQHIIIDFFGLLETLFIEILNEQDVNKTITKNMMPALDHIDPKNCGTSLVQESAQTAHNTHKTKQDMQKLLFKELLRRWKPNKKTVIN